MLEVLKVVIVSCILINSTQSCYIVLSPMKNGSHTDTHTHTHTHTHTIRNLTIITMYFKMMEQLISSEVFFLSFPDSARFFVFLPYHLY